MVSYRDIKILHINYNIQSQLDLKKFNLIDMYISIEHLKLFLLTYYLDI